jgi:hypothetical protein
MKAGTQDKKPGVLPRLNELKMMPGSTLPGGRAAGLFTAVVRIGVAVNLLLAIPGIFAPAFVLGMFGLDPGSNDVWARFAAVLLMLLSVFYIPAGSSAFRGDSWLVLLPRFVGVAFFLAVVLILGNSPRLLMLGLIDLVFGACEATLLWTALAGRSGARSERP